jgi:hypothetical protein
MLPVEKPDAEVSMGWPRSAWGAKPPDCSAVGWPCWAKSLLKLMFASAENEGWYISKWESRAKSAV